MPAQSSPPAQPNALPPYHRHDATPRQFGKYLLDYGHLSVSDLLAAQRLKLKEGATLLDSLIALHPDRANELSRHYADWLGLPYYPAGRTDAPTEMIAGFDPQRCVRLSVLPLSQQAGKLHLAVADPTQFDPKLLRADLGWSDCVLHYAPRARIHASLQSLCDTELSQAASARVAAYESCRSWGLRPNRRTMILVILTLTLMACFALWPRPSLLVFTSWALATLILAATMKMLAVLAYLTRQRDRPPPAQAAPLPHISILVPLYKEPEVLPDLLSRLARLDYPAGLLDVLLLLEETDSVTRAALDNRTLPDHVQILIVPDGSPRTKPRAMNYALDFCRGDIVGIYDAEDAPEPDQLHKVTTALHNAPADLAGVQGVLDYYNPRQNWIARCFTIEYAAWFRVMLPGMRRLGFAIPLGGTTVFCRRDVLLELGGWDAHNVTEDADLGIRLARHGYRIEMLPSTTFEEANCRPVAWVKQRSRWLKGYMATYLVHMRAPLQLLRELGLWQFCGVQLHFITALSQFCFAPLLWSFWIIPLGFDHPLDSIVPRILLDSVALGFIVVECLTFLIAATACHAAERRHLLPWVPILHFYFPMAVLAIYKALFELIFVPFYWDKTQHGISQAGLYRHDLAQGMPQTPQSVTPQSVTPQSAHSAKPADIA